MTQSLAGAALKVAALPRQHVLTRDGITLATDLFCPAGEGRPHPVIYLRTPWNSRSLFMLAVANALAEHGFAVVLQNMRGRYGSGGAVDAYDPAQVSDGLDTLAWMGQQPWCDGNVGLLGFSYGAYAAFATAVADVPGISVRTVVSLGGFTDPYRQFYRHGALQLHWALPFNVLLAGERQEALSSHAWEQLFPHLPLETFPNLLQRHLPTWDAVIRHPLPDEHWHLSNVTEQLVQRQIPALHVLGWYDFQLDAAMHAYLALRDCGQPQMLLAGPWDHGGLFAALGRHASKRGTAPGEPDLIEEITRWMRRWTPTCEKPEPQPLVRFCVTNTGQWDSTVNWPPALNALQPLYLSPGRALEAAPAADHGSDTWVSDPTDPVPTLGGQVWPLGRLLQPGPADQRPVQARSDVVTYLSPPLAADLRIAGPVSLELYTAAADSDADYHAKLVAVRPDGYAAVICDGVVRLSYHRCLGGAADRLTISLGHTAHQFARGERIGLELAGSNFPKYARVAGAPVQQSAQFGSEQPSRLLLPLLDAWPGWEHQR